MSLETWCGAFTAPDTTGAPELQCVLDKSVTGTIYLSLFFSLGMHTYPNIDQVTVSYRRQGRFRLDRAALGSELPTQRPTRVRPFGLHELADTGDQ